MVVGIFLPLQLGCNVVRRKKTQKEAKRAVSCECLGGGGGALGALSFQLYNKQSDIAKCKQLRWHVDKTHNDIHDDAIKPWNGIETGQDENRMNWYQELGVSYSTTNE